MFIELASLMTGGQLLAVASVALAAAAGAIVVCLEFLS